MDTVNVIAKYKMLSGQDASGIKCIWTFLSVQMGLWNILWPGET